jgi:HlyB family type I secretion system ABC transporter
MSMQHPSQRAPSDAAPPTPPGGDSERVSSAGGDAPGNAPARIVSVAGQTEADAGTRDRGDDLLRCLLRVALEFGRPLSEADVRSACALPPEGMTPELYLRAAMRLGYRAKRATIGRDAGRDLPEPYVLCAHGDLPDRLVLRRLGEQLVVFDPIDGGERELPAAAALVPGRTVLLARPESETVPRGDWRALVAKRVRRVAGELMLASVLVNLFALITPLYSMTVYNKVVGTQALDTLDVLTIGVAIVYGFDTLLRIIRGYISSHTGARIDALVGSEVVHHLLRLPYSHFERTPTGLIGERLRQLDIVRNFFTGQMPLVIVDLVFVLFFVTALFLLDPLIGWLTVGAMPLFLALSLAFHRAQTGFVERTFAALAAKTSVLAETVANALTIKSLGLESDMERRWSSRLAFSATTGFEAGNVAGIVGVLGNLLQAGVYVAVIYSGAQLIAEGKMSVGALVAASILSSRALSPIRQVVSAWHQLHEVGQAFKRLDEIMTEPMEDRPGELAPIPPLRGDVAFEHVSFRFAPDRPPVLRDIDLAIESGTMLGIIGPSGSGKSTLARLLQGLYAPTEGRVLIDRTDIAHVSAATLRRQIGSVPQEVQLFSGTVRENIAMGVSLKEPERVIAVAKFVGAHDFIQRLPKGYDTVLPERGGGLSAGQRQLLCIARALIRNPRILVLDEATSALDAATEEAFIRNLRRASRGRTIVLVSHRMAPVSIADRVAFLIEGRIERVGPPAEIIAYARSRTGVGQPPPAGVGG